MEIFSLILCNTISEFYSNSDDTTKFLPPYRIMLGIL